MVLSHILWSTYYGPKSDFSYYTDISKRAENKFVKSYPCSNRPVICGQYQDCYWSYNLTEHYKFELAGIMCPNQIPEDERKHRLSKKLYLFNNLKQYVF